MGKFSKIKKYNLDSLSIDEKIKFLDKEMEKTGLNEEPTNSTKGVYVSTPTTPNQNFSDFEAIMTGGQRLGFSGADGNTAGNADLGLFSGLDGVALSPPHPVTGLRNSAFHVRDGTGGTTPLRPGKTTTRGFSDNPPVYTMGSCLWFFDSDFDNGAGQPAGKWCHLEYSNFDGETNGKWFFWDTIKPPSTLAGFYFANTDLSQHPCGDISDLIDNLNFPGVGGSIGTAETTVLTQDSVENPNFLAILMNLSGAAFDYLKDKAEEFRDNFQSNTDGLGQDLKDHWGETWNDLTNAVNAIVEFGQGMGDQAAGLLDGLNNLYAISSVANDAKNNGHITDDNQIKEGEKGSITNPHENFVSDGTARHILDGVDIGGSNMGAEIQSNVEANPLSGDGNWGSKGIHNNLPGKGVNPDQYPSPYIDSEGNLHIPDTYKFAKTGFLPRKYSPTGWDQEKVAGGQNPHVKWTILGLADLNYYWSRATGSSETEAKQNAQETANGVAAFFDKSIGNILPGTVGSNSPMIHFETIIPANQIDRVTGNRGKTNESYISESVKLGHFEPEVLNVDIKNIRKGIMPEFPKKEPPKMIDGYSERSQLAPKKAEREPFIKITKKDLAKNHKLKDSEIKEFMDTFNMINDFVKKHPEELIYAQQRYPMSDKRLAALNWKMDQMLNAGQEYLDTQFPENQRLVDRIKKATKKTMELTNPEAYKGLKKPDMKLMSLDDHMKEKRVVSRHFKKKRQSKSMFRIDMEKVKEKNRKVAEQKVAEWQEKRRIELLNSNEFENQKSDWRKEFGENFVNTTQGMKVGQTFTHVPSGQTVTTGGALGGIETVPSTVSIFGDDIPGPTASQYGLQGFAKPIDMMRRGNKKAEKLNKELDSSEEYTKEVKADEFMKARIDDEEKTPDWYKSRQKSGYYREKLGPIHGAMTDLDELKMNERLVQENERQHEIYKKNEETRVKHQKVIDKKIKPHLDKINSGLDKKIDLRTLYQRGAVVNDDGTQGLMIRKETKSAMGLSLTKTVITSYRGKNLSTVGSVANREKLGITGQGKMTKVAEIKDPRLLEYKMPEELEMWQSQSVDPTGAIPRPVGAQLAAKAGVKSAFDMVNYYIDNHVLNFDPNFDPNKRINLTHLITDRTKNILQKGMDNLKPEIDAEIEKYKARIPKIGEKQARGFLEFELLGDGEEKQGLINSYFRSDSTINNKILQKIQRVDIFNSLGNNLGFNIDHYMKTGNYQFDSTYKFTSTLDMGVRVPYVGGITSILSAKYVAGQLHGETMMAVQNPMQYRVDIDSSKQYSPEPSKAVKGIKSISKTRNQSLSLDEPIVRRKKKRA